MKNSQFERTPLCFFPHRPLKSGTYQSLIQILSHCQDHSEVLTRQEPRLESCERGELVGTNCLVFEKDRVGDESYEAIGFETMEIDEDENDSLLQHKDRDLGFNRQQLLMDELEHIVKGNGKLINDQEEHVDTEQMVNEESEEVQLHVDNGHHNVKISEHFDLSVDQSTADFQISKASGDCEDGISLSRGNTLELEYEMQQKVMALEKLAHTDYTIGSHNNMPEDIEVEEGEISGDFEVGDALVDKLFDNDAISEEKKDDEKQVSKPIIDKRDLTCNDQIRADETFSECSSFVGNAVDCTNNGISVELNETVNNEKQVESQSVDLGASMLATDADRSNFIPAAGRNKRKANRVEGDANYVVAHLNSPTMHGEILEQSPNWKHGIISEKRLDSSVCNKKKRSILSKERKAQKKQRERKKRAEKNRQLGVKRLKLQPVLKPKTVTYCRHYLMGRCQEGDKCKFSHDTIPLTKSKPCCHFARNSCMKGDDCPFDHQLSKYPCNNFLTKGFCIKGDDCMFSHKRPSKEDTPSLSTSEKGLKPPSPLNISNPQKLPNIAGISSQNVDSLFNVRKVLSFKNAEQNVAETPLKPPALTPKGINCLFFGKSSVVESSKPKQGSSSPKRNEGSKVGNQSEQSVLASVQTMNGTPNRALQAIASRGVNFLSFGKAPLEGSTGKKLASVLMNSENGVNSSLLNNFNLHKEASSPCNGEKSTQCWNQTTQSVSSTVKKSNELLKKTHPSFTPQGSNVLYIGKDLKNVSIRDKIASLSSSSNNVINRSFQESQNTPDKHSAIPWTPPDSLLATGDSSDHLAKVQYKNTPDSSQKALMSTLAFASKIETEMKINTSAASTSANCQTRGNRIDGAGAGSSGGPLNDSGKASKILEFLYGIGKKVVNT